MPSPRHRTLTTFPNVMVLTAGLAFTVFLCLQAESSALEAASQAVTAQSSSSSEASPSASSSRQLLDRYCVTCHNDRLETAGLSLEQIDIANVHAGAEVWEQVVRKLRTGTMPPSPRPQPSAGDRGALVSWLETSLDRAAAANPNPGRTETLRRLNRTEYQNSIRDLLALDVDATGLLPPDESGYGFDNVNVGDLSPALLDRYISAAQKISRLAVGSTQTSLQSDVLRVPADTTQEEHVAGLPIGTRGGMSASYTFAQDGEYDIQIRLARNRTGNIGGLRGQGLHTVQLLLDRMPVATFTVERPEGGDDALADSHLKLRVPVDGRSARRGGHVSQERLVAARNRAPAPAVALQRAASSASDAGHLPGDHHGTVCGAGRRRHAEPPPALRLHANPAQPARGRRGVRRGDSLDAHAARLPSADLRSRCRGADGVLPGRAV